MILSLAESLTGSIGTAASFVGLGITSIIFILVLAIDIWLTIWVYRDAKKNFHNPVIWALLTLLTSGYLGIIVYLVLKELHCLKSSDNKQD